MRRQAFLWPNFKCLNDQATLKSIFVAALMSFLTHMSTSLAKFLRRCRQVVEDVVSRHGKEQMRIKAVALILNRAGINSLVRDSILGFL